jgi:DNA-binding LytR/AlgR family response regulator
MNITCYVVDDESSAINILVEYILKTPGLELMGFSQSPLKALDQITIHEAPMLTFIDVDMVQLSGLDLAGMINSYTVVVFTTAFPQFALDAFDREAFDYLLKPINYERFLKCIQRVKKAGFKQLRANQLFHENFFNIKSDVKGRIIKIKFSEVVYIEGAQNYIIIYTTEGKHMTYLTMNEIEQQLPRGRFPRVHRSFLINIDFVKVIEHRRVKLNKGFHISLVNVYKEPFLKTMETHLIKTKRLH